MRRGGRLGGAAALLLALVACTTASPSPSGASMPSAGTASAPATAPADATAASTPPAGSAATTSASTSPTAPPVTSPPTDGGDAVTVLMTGDVLIHTPLVTQADADAPGPALDFAPMLAAQRPRVSAADLAICHMETPLAPPEGPFTGYPTFKAPPQVVPALKDVGYDACTTASNHTLDAGAAGIARTLATLDAAGIRHTGSARSQAERDTPLVMTVSTHGGGQVRIGLVAAAYGTNGIPVPASAPYEINLIDVPRMVADAAAARRAGADIVIVAVHAGTEYDQSPNDQQRTVAQALLASPDVDLVYMHHAHVVLPFERIGAKWVAYGLGNTLAKTAIESNTVTAEQVMARFTFARGADGRYAVSRAAYVPALMPFTQPYRWVDLAAALADPSMPAALRQRYQQAADHIRQVVGSRGAFAAGLSVAGATG